MTESSTVSRRSAARRGRAAAHKAEAQDGPLARRPSTPPPRRVHTCRAPRRYSTAVGDRRALAQRRLSVGSSRWPASGGCADVRPAAGIFSVPSACAGACGVVEEQVALRASAAPQPVGFEGVEFCDEASGKRRSHRRVGPDQLLPRRAIGDNELNVRGAVGGERIDDSTVQSVAGHAHVRSF